MQALFYGEVTPGWACIVLFNRLALNSISLACGSPCFAVAVCQRTSGGANENTRYGRFPGRELADAGYHVKGSLPHWLHVKRSDTAGYRELRHGGQRSDESSEHSSKIAQRYPSHPPLQRERRPQRAAYGTTGSTTTATINSVAGAVLTLATAGDFANGQNVQIPHGGATPAISAPTARQRGMSMTTIS